MTGEVFEGSWIRAAARLVEDAGQVRRASAIRAEADTLLAAVERSLGGERASRYAIPVGPYRRLDCGAIGSLAAGYTLEIWPEEDARLADIVSYLLENAFLGNAFFHDIIRSGINPYLTLHVAQVLLRAGDERCVDLMRAVAALATPTGPSPEAVHPRTWGGVWGMDNTRGPPPSGSSTYGTCSYATSLTAWCWLREFHETGWGKSTR